MPSPFTDSPDSFGDFFHVRLNGTTLDDVDKKVLSELRPVGVQLTDHNFLQDAPYEKMLEALRKLLEDVYSTTGQSEMLVSIDHEGGRVHRLPKPFTHFPSASEYFHRSYEVAQAMGEELKSLGINLSFSPSADVNSNPNNPVIGKRSFHADPNQVSVAALQFAQGLKDAGIIACAKHFPGHGDTKVDSHFGLPEILADEEGLTNCELLPFRDLIDAGIPMVMTAHILFPKLDAHFPATLSQEILQKLLRQRLQFSGVVITDDLDMQAITNHFDEFVLAERVLAAGSDILLLNHQPIRGLQIARHMFTLLDNGQLSEDLLRCSQERIYSLFQDWQPKSTVRALPNTVFLEHGELKAELLQ